MEDLLQFALILALVFVLIAVHELGHYIAGRIGGIPASDMKLALMAFPQHVALLDEGEWVSPVRDIGRYVEISGRHLRSRNAAFWWVAGGMLLELAFASAACGVALGLGHRAVAFWVASMSLGMYLINVGLMDLPWAIRYRRAAGDTSGLWQIAPAPAFIFSIIMLASRVLIVTLSV